MPDQEPVPERPAGRRAGRSVAAGDAGQPRGRVDGGTWRGQRTAARRRALDILYEADLLDREIALVLAKHLHEELPDLAHPDPYTVELVQGVDRMRTDIDDRIRAAAEHWTLERMPLVDRNILRLATYELLRKPDEPPTPVILNEAVEMAKLLSTDDSGRFVNGVLSAIARGARPA